MTILGDDIPSKVFNSGVHYHQIKPRLNSALISTVTATSDGLFAQRDGCLGLLGTILIVLNLMLAQYFKPSNVYIFSFVIEIPLWQSQKHRTMNNDAFCILWHQLRVLFPLHGVGTHVGWLHSWENVRTTQFALGGMWSERWKRYVVSKQRPPSQTVLTGKTKCCLKAPHLWGAWWLRTMQAVPVYDHYTMERKIGNQSKELELLGCFFSPTRPLSFLHVSKIPQASQSISSLPYLHNTTPPVPTHTR
jgi:hypothetical protein